MIAERSSNNAQLPYWDELLVEQGAFQLLHRAQALTFLNERAASVHTRLTNNSELLSIHYQPALSADTTADDWEIFSASTLPDLEAIKAMMRKNLQIAKPREIARGVTLIGPHRDEFRIAANGIDLNLYGSRGQVRTALLSLKFAETDWMERTMGTMPIILLDETLAELDEQRRSDLQSWLNQIPQGILTTTDLTHFHPDFIATHTVRTVENGLIREISELKRADEL
jgi:DNA replication and repair protein RecF